MAEWGSHFLSALAIAMPIGRLFLRGTTSALELVCSYCQGFLLMLRFELRLAGREIVQLLPAHQGKVLQLHHARLEIARLHLGAINLSPAQHVCHFCLR